MKLIFDDGTELCIRKAQVVNVCKDNVLIIEIDHRLSAEAHKRMSEIIEATFEPDVKVMIFEDGASLEAILRKGKYGVSESTDG